MSKQTLFSCAKIYEITMVCINKTKVPSGPVYICEDHLNLEEDLLNYKEWKENKVTRPRLKPQVPAGLKNINRDQTLPSTSAIYTDTLQTSTQDKGIQCVPTYLNKLIQINPSMVNRSTNRRLLLKRKLNQAIVEEESSEGHHPSTVASTTEFSGNESSDTKVQKCLTGRSFILSLIENKPLAYIGVPKQYYWIIKHISQECNIPSIHIIITLYKIKSNEVFVKIRDLFEISLATLWRMFYKTLNLLSVFFKQLVHWPTILDIKRNLPTCFTSSKEYASIQSIIDCFEIEIEKPKKPIDQALTWSQYKNCNTIKYLISATPDGYVTFISEGCGGRISDINLVEQSGFLEKVPKGATILSDRGFKHLESHLTHKEVRVLRPPSVLKDIKMTRAEVIESKVLASLRIHIERVIRRVRLFKMLKPHSVVNNKLIRVMDDVVIVACGLLNLQTPVIKKY